MTKLSEIEAAYKDRDYTKGDYLSHQWYCERGITVHHGDTPQSVMMRYIERLETKLSIVVPALQSIATPALGGKSQQYTAQHALKELEQHEREEAR